MKLKLPFISRLPYLCIGCWVLLVSLPACPLWAQEVRATLNFEADTTALGKPVDLRMAIEHPASIVVVFPEAQDFKPFELVSRRPEPTRTVNGISWDVVTYQVRTFELSPKQAMRLPFGYFEGQDTVQQFAESDTILLNERIPTLLPEMAFKPDQSLAKLEDPPNLTLLFGLISAGLLVLLVLAVLLRRPIQRYIARRRNQLEYLSLKRQLKKLEYTRDQVSLFDQLNHIWKSYLDPQDQEGFRSMTTTELRNALAAQSQLNLEQQKALVMTSEATDQVIYAGNLLSEARVKELILGVSQVLDALHRMRQHKTQKE